MSDRKVARALGWASIGIGLTEILAPRFLSKKMGIGEHDLLLRTMGAREIAEGIGILSARADSAALTAGVWSRVVGDALDLSLLGFAAASTRKPGMLAMIGGLVLGITGLDAFYAVRLQGRQPLTMEKAGRAIGDRVADSASRIGQRYAELVR